MSIGLIWDSLKCRLGDTLLLLCYYVVCFVIFCFKCFVYVILCWLTLELKSVERMNFLRLDCFGTALYIDPKKPWEILC